MKSPEELAAGSTSEKGFTLVEMLVTTVVLMLLTGPLLIVFQQSGATFRAQSDQGEMAEQMRIAMDQITRCIRQAGNDPLEALAVPGVNPISSNHIQLNTDITGSVPSGTGNPLESSGDPDGTLNSLYESVSFRQSGTDLLADIGFGEEVLAEGISQLSFTYLDINGAPTMVPDDVARVQVTMVATTDRGDMRNNQLYSLTLQSEVFVRSMTPNVIP